MIKYGIYIWQTIVKHFFLPWKGTAKKISYAASLGAVNKIDDTNAENIKKWLKDFNMVSVREDSGANTLEKIDR